MKDVSEEKRLYLPISNHKRYSLSFDDKNRIENIQIQTYGGSCEFKTLDKLPEPSEEEWKAELNKYLDKMTEYLNQMDELRLQDQTARDKLLMQEKD